MVSSKRQRTGVHAGSPATSCPEPIAIVGMGCRWPGGVRNPSQLWDLLKEKRDGWAEFTPDRINLDGFYHPNGQRPASMCTKGGHMLQEDPRLFDHAFFGISATEAMSMDPSQRKLLEVTYEAFDSAGEPFDKFFGSKTGVFVGNFNNDHQLMQFRDPDHTLPYVVTGGGPTILSNRINYVFNLQGPSLMVDTGCSASMYAMHLAVLSIQNGDCEAAIVAGGNLVLGPDGQTFTTKLGAVSPTSRCHTFDASADGYSRAEGFGALYLKKLSDALAQGDPIRAVVRGTSYNANGKTGGISHPSAEGQEAVIRQAYKAAGGLDPSLTGYFECHGTGTPVGDPTEVSALGKVFASGRIEEPLLIGSIKPNLGHSEAASAMSQIMKAILSMEHGEIPATIGIEKFNPAIDFAGARVKVVTDMTPWPTNTLRRVSINSFGYGGANAHCILDHPSVVLPEYQLRGLPLSRRRLTNRISLPNCHINGYANGCTDGLTNGYHDGHTNGKTNGINGNGHTTINGNGHSAVDMTWLQSAKKEQTEQAGARPFILLPFSAHDGASLKTQVTQASGLLKQFNLADTLYTLGSRKSTFSRRAFAVLKSNDLNSIQNPDCTSFGKTPRHPTQKIGFVFTGQGAQWPEMGAKLIHEYAAFRRTIHYLDDVLSQLSQRPSWNIEDALEEPAATSRIQDPAFSQTVCTALQIALVNLLRQWGIQPTVTIGHSSGEIAAAYAAGRLRASEAIVLAYFRGQVVATNQRKGLMIAIGLGPDQVESHLAEFGRDLRIAAVNSPESTTVSGEPEAIQGLAAKLTSQNVFNRVLKTGGNAYHSHHMLSLGEAYETLATQGLCEIEFITTAEPVQHSATWHSSVTPEKKIGFCPPSYWRRNLESSVLFSQAVAVLARDTPVDLMIEIGPHPALSGPLKQIRTGLEKNSLTLPNCLATLRRGEHDVASLLNLAGGLFLHDAPVDLVAVNATEEVRHGTITLQHGYQCIDMPQYNFTYPEKPVYFENRFSKEFRTRKHPRHDLLGARQPGCSRTHPSWRNMLRMKDLPWLDDHKLLPHAVLPAAAYIAMAVEAVTQMHHEADDALPIKSFTLRNVAINSTLRVKDDEFGVETVLNMEKMVLTNADVLSSWYKFSIGSVVPESGVWTENCAGTISTETRETTIDQDQRLQADSRSRSLDVKRWYEKFAHVGLGYGPTFQGLSNLKAYRGANIAAAHVALNPTEGNVNGGESRYTIHPTTLDTCLQLALISAHAGQVEHVKKAFVPIVADEISIWVPKASERQGWGVATGNHRGLRSLYARSQLYATSGAPLLDISELKCVAYESVSDAAETSLTSTREPYWRPVARLDVDSLTCESAKSMFPSKKLDSAMIEEFDRFCSYVLANVEAGLDDDVLDNAQSQNHESFAKWVRSWTSSQMWTDVLGITVEDRAHAIDTMLLELGDIPEVQCIKALADNLDKVLAGETNSIRLLMEHNLLEDLNNSGIIMKGAYAQLQRLIDLLAHKNPKMRILEIGAGGSGATAAVLDTLASRTTFRRFDEYVFTDAAEWCISDAQAKFNGYNGMSFQTLDIQQDVATQGFQAESFDLVIASGILGQVTDLNATLRNVRSLLKPGGRLALLETTRPRLGCEILARTMTGKWDQRQLFQSQDAWSQLLTKSGFSGIDLSLDDYAREQTMSTVMLTTANTSLKQPSGQTKTKRDVYLVYRDYPPPLARAIDEQLEQQGFHAIYTNLLSSDNIPQGSPVISLGDIENTTLLNCDEVYFKATQRLITDASTIIWIATDATSRPGETSTMKGMLRSVATENVLSRIALIEMNGDYLNSRPRTAELITRKFAELHTTSSVETVDRECMLRDGTLYVERFLPDLKLNEQFRLRHGLEDDVKELPMEGQGKLKACYKQPGLLSSLYFTPDLEFDQPLKESWVEIKTEAIGLNMKDIAVATGRFDWDSLSTEAAGTITKLGPGVMSLQVGDRVYGMIFGNMGNYVRSPASALSIIPENRSFTEAASMPVSYLTCIYALRHVAQLSEGEAILIQSAAGALGMAAIHIAQHAGAEIYVTVSTDEKRKVLMNDFGIPESHIFDSRSVSAVDDIMCATDRKGVDVILSSSAGDLMHEMWRCIGPMGHFIDVGRTDVAGAGKLGLEVFKRNATFSSFDMGLLHHQKLTVVAKLMKELGLLWDEGAIRPIDHITTFDISKLETAMTTFSKGVHTGKFVITFNDLKAKLNIARSADRASLDPEAAYILVGALGGLGRSLAVYMVERGARHLVFLSRSGADKPEAAQLVNELIGMGTKPEVIRCSVTDRGALVSVMEQVSSRRTVKGVIHAAMVEGDAFFDKASYSQIQAVLAPKVTGTVNLHHATKHLPLDFFLMTSSIVATIGTATQGAYSAANAFQDAFARFRLDQGLPATALGLGLILEVGSVSESVAFQEMLQRNASYGISETEFLQLFEGALCQSSLSDAKNSPLSKYDRSSAGQITVGLEPARFIPYVHDNITADLLWYTNPRFQAIANAISTRVQSSTSTGSESKSAGSSTSSLSAQLRAASSPAEKIAIAREAVIERLAKLVSVEADEIDADKPMTRYGVDSLVAAELRNWLIKSFGVDVTLLQLLSKATKIEDLVKAAIGGE